MRPTFQAQGKYSGGAPIPNEFYVGDPSDVGFRKESSNVALMVGSVFGEFFTFAPMPFDRNNMTKEEGEKEEKGNQTKKRKERGKEEKEKRG